MGRFSKGKRPWTIVVAAALLALPLAAGSLDPPGPPAPTMKTLDQVEPRVPIHAADLPLTISAPGSYYLAEDIDMPAGGITIASSNVTVDLGGFRFRGNVAGDGITASGTIENIIVKNGFVVGWLSDGIDLGNASEVHVIDVHASRNFGRGIVAGDDSRVVDSTARFNSGRGLFVGARSQVIRCQAFTNFDGIVTGPNALVTESIAVTNGGSGIFVGANSIVSRSVAAENSGTGIYGDGHATVSDSRVDFNEGGGIVLGANSTVTGCTARWNTVDGIAVEGGSVVRGNHAIAQTSGAGILLISGNGSLVTDNLVTSNDSGIKVTTAGNTIHRNNASLNATDYDIVAGNDVGPVGDAASSTSPWANIQF